MTSAPDPIILSSDVVQVLPLYYRALARHLVNSGRAIIRDPEQNGKPVEV